MIKHKERYADVAHLVERHLAKVEVASSSLVIRSIKRTILSNRPFCFVRRMLFLLMATQKVTFEANGSPARNPSDAHIFYIHRHRPGQAQDCRFVRGGGQGLSS